MLDAARAGAPWAFERLYEDLAPQVAGYLRGQRALAPENLTSEVFLGVFRGLGTFDGTEQQFRLWVFTIAHRRLLDERRRAARRPPLASVEDGLNLPGGDAGREVPGSLGERWAQRLSERLSADQRTVLLLRIIADLTAEEVAQITGETLGAVRALQRHGLEALRRMISEEGVQL